MPFKSKAQRGFMYANHPKLAKEFEEATPEGAHLPEHVKKMAYGGETNPKKETLSAMENNPTAGFAKGGEVKKEPFNGIKTGDYGTLAGLHALLKKAHPQPQTEEGDELYTLTGHPDNSRPDEEYTLTGHPHMAMGGDPSQALLQASQTAQNTPPTNYDFYKNMGAEERAALQQQLAQRQAGGGQAAISGLAGIGDAISNSFGKGGAQFQKGVIEQGQNATNQQLNAFDTQRQQKLQDMQGSQEMQMNDPNHPFAQGMREILKSQGINVPSGMNAALMLKVLGPLGELSYKQAMMGATVANQKEGHKLEAAKGLEGRGMIQRVRDAFSPSPETKAMQDTVAGKEDTSNAPHGIPDLGSTFNGGKVLKVTRVK